MTDEPLAEGSCSKDLYQYCRGIGDAFVITDGHTGMGCTKPMRNTKGRKNAQLL